LTVKQKNFSVLNKTFSVNPVSPESGLIAKAVYSLKKGGVIVFPTRCLYGLGADAFNIDAVKKIFAMKQRPFSKPVSILIKSISCLEMVVKNIPDAALLLIEKLWPGGITIVFEAKKSVPDILTAGTGKIGVRMPGHPVAAALLDRFDGPITGTSANISHSIGCSNPSKLDSEIAGHIDLILDAGELESGSGSTVVDITLNPPLILRHGTVSAKKIFSALKIN